MATPSPTPRIVLDGLWRCLCPALDTLALSQTLNKPTSGLAQRSRSRPTATNATTTAIPPCTSTSSFSSVSRQFRRSIFTKAPDNSFTGSTEAERARHAEYARTAYLQRRAKSTPWIPESFFENISNDDISPSQHNNGGMLGQEKSGSDRFNRDLQSASRETIYDALAALQESENSYFNIVRLAEHLVTQMGERPNARLYEALIKANVNHVHGSAEIARDLFREMVRQGITPSPKIYIALLQVTAVHPDYVLRSTVLRDMANRWYALDTEQLVTVALGLLRDGQYEAALEKLEEISQSPPHAHPWLHHIFLYIFGELGFHDESLKIVQHLVKNYGPDQGLSLWHFLLDVWSRDAFYPGITYIWNRHVARDMVNPPDGVALNVLNAASKNGDLEVATGVVQKLTSRGKKLELHHYEPLVEIHCQHGNVDKALMVLCIASRAGSALDSSSTRAIYELLIESPAMTNNAPMVLRELKSDHQVPIAAFNVVLEATGALHGFQGAFDLYRGVRQFCSGQPDLATYHALLACCTLRKSLDFILDELEAFSISPTVSVYDHAVRICAMQDDYSPAFRYIKKMGALGPQSESGDSWLSKDTAMMLIDRCVKARDARVHHVVRECQDHGVPVEAEVSSLFRELRWGNIRRVTSLPGKAGAAMGSSSDSRMDSPRKLSG